MKTKLPVLLLVLLASLELWAQVPPPAAPAAPATSTTPATPGLQRRRPPTLGGTNGFTRPLFTPPGAAAAPSAQPAQPTQPEETVPPNYINLTSADVNQVLEIYSKLVNKTMIRPATLPAGTIVLQNKTELTKSELKQALEAVLAINGITVVPMGEKFVKVVPTAEAGGAGGQFDTNDVANIPNLGPFMTHITQLHYVKPTLMIPYLQPYAKIQGGLSGIDDNGILVMRDYAENIKRMLEMIDRIDISVPAEFTSEVIPIRYAEAQDIASALSSLGGGGGGTVSFGSSSTGGTISGLRGGTSGGIGSMGGGGLGGGGLGGGGMGGGGLGGSSGIGGTGGARPFGSTTGIGGANGTPAAGGGSFQSRLQSIINRSGAGGGGGGGGQDQIQLFGQTKIIADQRSNSLLVFASRSDMEHIKEVIKQLDVLLAQVLIESIILDVAIGKDLTAGVSATQRPKQFNNSNVTGGGIMNNGNNSFLNFVQSAATNGTGAGKLIASIPTNSVGGLSYFGSIGDTWDIAVKAAESDNNASIIQRPRIQTSQAKPATFFVGQTVPYVTSTYNNAYNGGYGGSSYSQLSVGVELDVQPFINPDGLVVMDIGQEIDEISGYTTIDGNNVPNTVKRTLNTEIAVKNRDTVILGGFVQTGKTHTRSGVPILMNIPVLGWFFSSREDKKDRTELLVMMRPTVLKTPEIAAEQTTREARRLPGVSDAAFQNAVDENALIEAERKKELKNAKSLKNDPNFKGFFNTPVSDYPTNSPAPVTEPSVDPSAINQEKARAALEQQMNEPNQAPANPQQ